MLKEICCHESSTKELFTLLEGDEYLGLYKWNKNIAEHYFCKL